MCSSDRLCVLQGNIRPHKRKKEGCQGRVADLSGFCNICWKWTSRLVLCRLDFTDQLQCQLWITGGWLPGLLGWSWKNIENSWSRKRQMVLDCLAVKKDLDGKLSFLCPPWRTLVLRLFFFFSFSLSFVKSLDWNIHTHFYGELQLAQAASFSRSETQEPSLWGTLQ